MKAPKTNPTRLFIGNFRNSGARLLFVLGLIGLLAAAGPGPGPCGESPGNRVTGANPAPGRLGANLEQHLAQMQPYLQRYGYAAIFVAVLVEGVGVLAPGQTLLVVGAIAAAKGEFKIAWVLACAFLAAVLGNSLGYLLGRWGGRPLLIKLKVSEKRFSRLEGYFTRYGKWLVLLARFVDGFRQLNGLVAGMMKMPWKVFLVFTVLGAVLWTGTWGLGAYFLVKDIAALHLAVHRVRPWAVAVALLIFLGLMVYLLRRRRSGGTQA
jgi:membrane protein DedA with SNARE-associated domain